MPPSNSSRGPRPSPKSRPEIDPDPIAPDRKFPDEPQPLSDDGLEGAKKQASTPTEHSGEDTSVESGTDDNDPEAAPSDSGDEPMA